MSHAKLARKLFARRVQIDTDDHTRSGHAGALHYVQSNASEPEHYDIGTGLDLGGIDHCADARCNATSDIAHLLERRVVTDLRHRNLR